MSELQPKPSLFLRLAQRLARIFAGIFGVSGAFGLLFYAPGLGLLGLLHAAASVTIAFAPESWSDQGTEERQILVAACIAGILGSLPPWPFQGSLSEALLLTGIFSFPFVLFGLVLVVRHRAGAA